MAGATHATRKARCPRWLASSVWLACLLCSCQTRAQTEPPTPPTEEGGWERNALAADTALTAIRERVQANDTEGAWAALRALAPSVAERPELRYLRARLYEQQEQFQAALASLPDDLTVLPDLVARDVRKRRALWSARAGRCDPARPVLAELSHSDPQDSELTLSLADCALAQGDTAAAIAALRANRSQGSARFAVRRALAKALVQSGDKAAGLRELRTLYIEFPTLDTKSELYDELRALERGFRLTPQEAMTRAEHWLNAARPDPAWTELSRIVLPKARNARERRAQQADRARLAHLKGMALFRMRTRYAEAAKVLAKASNLEGTTTQAEDAFHAAQALARADRNAEAVRAYYAFIQRFPRDRLAHEARVNAAWLELRHNLPGGEEHMRGVLERAERSGAKQTHSDALWGLAFHSFKNKRCDKALPLFERYAGLSSDAMVKARGLYWAGRCAAVLGDRARSLAFYRSAMAVEPLHWYALLAKARIAAEGEDPGPPFPTVPTQATPSTNTQALAAEAVQLPPAAAFYARVGLLPDAVRALRAREKLLLSGAGRNDGLLRLVAAYHALGEYARPMALASRGRETLFSPPTPQLRPIWNALFPMPFSREMTLAGSSVSRELVYAVMRRESAFNPRVVSNADAIGLLQLIERTAERCAQELGMQGFERASLYDPLTNIRLGSHYLGKLLERYHGQAAPAIAAYNAGEHRVDPWLDRVARGAERTVELDWFVEEIPFEQTRNYVRRVVTYWARYLYLQQGQDDRWPLDLTLSWKRR